MASPIKQRASRHSYRALDLSVGWPAFNKQPLIFLFFPHPVKLDRLSGCRARFLLNFLKDEPGKTTSGRGQGQGEELAALGALSQRAPMGNGAGGLFRPWKQLGELPPRPLAPPRLPLGRGRPAGMDGPPVPALFRPGALERPGRDSQGAALRSRRKRGQSRRGREGMLLLPRFHTDAFLHQGALQVSAGHLSLHRGAREEPGVRPDGTGAGTRRHGRV